MEDSLHHLSCLRSAADILGTKWTALILRELAASPRRYCEIERAIPDINPRTLSQRLASLQQHAIITEIDHHYELTRKGRDLLPILRDMADWSARYPRDSVHDSTRTIA
ncbi:MAG: helix-turn-helix domain-containing protein [Candidatus Saccharimonadales bacterium]